MSLRNQVQLITYPDSLGKNLLELHYVLRRYFQGMVGGVHLLPFYPSSGDRGFSPITYDEVEPLFGSWADVDAISRDFDLTIDFMINHISRQSVYFQDFLDKGRESEYADMFLTFSKLSPDGDISEEDLGKVYSRKPRHPYMVIERPDGSEEKIWCTFGYEQIDLDWQSPKTREVMRNYLIKLARNGAKMIRMDAFAYTTVKVGTNCFFLEPEIWEILDWLKGFVEPFDTEMLPEVHEHHRYQLKLAEKGFWVYDFALPLLVLHTLYHHTSRRLVDWLKICPRRQITTLDTHDGIGVVDVTDLMAPAEIENTIDRLYEKGSNVKQIYSGPEYQNLDIYQVNCTYYSALGENDDSYMAARAIQFFTPGIPQIYYVGLLAGRNDIELVEQTKNGRDINRHNYSLDEIEAAVQKPVVRRLMRLLEFRSNYPVFDGDFFVEEADAEHQLVMMWQKDRHQATLHIDLETCDARITYFDPEKKEKVLYVV